MGWNNQPAKDLFLAHFFQHETSSNVEERLKRARQELTMNGEQQNEPWWNAVDSWDGWSTSTYHSDVSMLRSSNLTMKNPLI